jgi:hypothetical protein
MAEKKNAATKKGSAKSSGVSFDDRYGESTKHSILIDMDKRLSALEKKAK